MRTRTALLGAVGVLAATVMAAGPATAGKPAPPPPNPTSTVEFQNATYSVSETIGNAPVRLVRSSGSSTLDTWVRVAATDATATSPADYTTFSDPFKIAAGSNTGDALVPIVNDLIDENAETINLTLLVYEGAGAAQLGKRKTAKLTINDNDAPPTLSVADDGTTEGNNENFVVSLSGPSGLPVSFTWGTAQTSAGGTKDATSGVDYTAFTAKPGSISAGSTSVNIAVPTAADSIYEDNQTFKMVVSSVSNASILDGTGIGTIVDNDAPPVLSIASTGGTSESSGPVQIVVTKTGATEYPATAKLTTTDGSASPNPGTVCTAGDDYLQLVGQTVTLLPADLTVSIPVTVCDDSVAEVDETFAAYLSDPNIASVNPAAASQLVTIADDEAGLVELTPGTQNATAGGSDAHVVTVKTLSGTILTTPATVHYEVWRDRDSNQYYDFVVGADEVVTGSAPGSYSGGAAGDEDVIVACLVTAAAGNSPACGVATDSLVFPGDAGDMTIGEDTQLDGFGIAILPGVDSADVIWVP